MQTQMLLPHRADRVVLQLYLCIAPGASAFAKGLLNGQYNYRKVICFSRPCRMLSTVMLRTRTMRRQPACLFGISCAGPHHLPAAVVHHMHAAAQAFSGAIVRESCQEPRMCRR